MAGHIIVVGFNPTSKNPGFKAASIIPGAGGSAQLPGRTCLLIGQLGTGATIATNTPFQVFSADDAIQTGARSELAQMIYATAKSGATVWAVGSPAPTGSPAGATVTFTITGSWTTGGQYQARVCGRTFNITVAANSTVQVEANNLKDVINSDPHLPGLASVGASPGYVVTVTIDSANARGNNYYAFKDTSLAPSGFALALAGDTATTGGLVPFINGTGTEDVTTMLTALSAVKYDRYGVAQNDATNLGYYKTQVNAKAAPTVGLLEHVIYAYNKSLSALASITSGINDARFCALWELNAETHPSVIAAVFAANRALVESSDPSPGYINAPLMGVLGQAFSLDFANDATIEAALGEGVSPIVTNPDGTAVVRRGVTNYYKKGSNLDYRALDINDPVMADYGRDRYKIMWEQDIAPNFEHVRDNPGDQDPRPPAGVLYPKLMQSFLSFEKSIWEKNGWIVDAALTVPNVVFNATLKILEADDEIRPTPINAIFAMNVRQG